MGDHDNIAERPQAKVAECLGQHGCKAECVNADLSAIDDCAKVVAAAGVLRICAAASADRMTIYLHIYGHIKNQKPKGMGRVRGRAATVLLAALAGLVCSEPNWAQTKTAHVGILTFFAPEDDPTLKVWYEPFRRTLAEQGWTEGNNVSFDYCGARGSVLYRADEVIQ